MLERELQSLQVKKDGLADEARRTFHYGDLARRHEQLDIQIKAVKNKLHTLNEEQIQMATASVHDRTSAKTLTTALQRGASASKKVTNSPLRPAVDRMQSKPALDMDDSAAHESTEAAAAAVPKAWADQANLLQSARVERTSSKMPYPSLVPKWVDEMADRQEAAANDTAAHERAAKLAKTDALLQAEVSRQKLVMQSQEERSASSVNAQRPTTVETKSKSIEDRYKAKLAAMKEELNLAYQQSSRHADEFRDQISKSLQRSENAQDLEAKYKAKLAAMKENLDTAYKQSAKHADEFNKQVQKLSDQLKRAKETSHSASPTVPASATQQALVKEIRGIYEQAYGVIGQESKSTPAMEDALAGFDKMTAYEGHQKPRMHSTGPVKEVDNAYTFQKDNLETELASPAPLAKTVNNAYDFKDDGLEQELAASPLAAKSVEPRHTSKQDALEQELAKFSQSSSKTDKAVSSTKHQREKDSLVMDAKTGVYRFHKDNLEAELTAKAEPVNQDLPDLDAKAYDFKDDDLEAELTQRWRTMKRNGVPWRQRYAELKEVYKMVNEVKHGRSVNPVDGTAAPVTGNYASPTGFVRFDDPVMSQTDTKRSGKSGASSTQDHPRVKREEAVFTGTRRVHGSHDMSSRDGARRARRRQRRARKIAKTLALVTVLSLGGAYVYGMQIENSEMKRLGGQEAWARMVQKYEQGGERGIVEAIKEMKQTDPKWSSGLFWK